MDEEVVVHKTHTHAHTHTYAHTQARKFMHIYSHARATSSQTIARDHLYSIAI